MKENKTVGVIGAGASGICAAKYALQHGFDVNVFEKGSQVGGTWIYTDNTGKDEYGLDIHSSMYQGLHTNLPKEVMGYNDFPVTENKKSYISAEDFLKFLKLYANEFNVIDCIKFQHLVMEVKPIDGNRWRVVVKDLPTDTLFTFIYDFLFVCNGHYSVPFYVEYPGKEIYKGRIFHSHSYRSGKMFQDERVLVIGGGSSARDIAYDLTKYSAKVTLSHHNDKLKDNYPSIVCQKPDVVRLTENGAQFEDGTSETFSVIVFCTGYQYTFPFLREECEIVVNDRYVQSLYKHIININHPTMSLIGIPFLVTVIPMFDLQVRFAMQYYTGRKNLPTKDEMLSDTQREMNERWKKGYKNRHAHMMGPDKEKYYDELSETAEIEYITPAIKNIHNESSKRFASDFVHFRNDIYKIIDNEHFIQEI